VDANLAAAGSCRRAKKKAAAAQQRETRNTKPADPTSWSTSAAVSASREFVADIVGFLPPESDAAATTPASSLAHVI